MSILSGCAGGTILGKAELVSATRCEETYEGLKERIYAGLLPAQKEFCDDTDHLILGLCAGFGAGKTRALCSKVLLLCMDNPGRMGAVFEPTAVLLRDIWMRAFDEYLEEMKIEYEFRVSPLPEYEIHVPGGSCKVICRTTETYRRIIGTTLAFCCVDELDTSPQEVSAKAVEMMLARLRGCKNPQLAIASTPEGYRTLWQLFASDEAQGMEDRRLIKAKTRDNPWLPSGFVESLQRNYSPQLLAAYLEGDFVNLESTTVYYPFDRDKHWTDEVVKDDDRLLCGIDFNVGACFVEVIVRRGDEFHVVAEHHPKDTPHLVTLLQETYPRQLAQGNLVCIPDAASRQRSTMNAAESDLSLLRKGGFEVKAQTANPQVADRVNAVNVLLLANKLRVHGKCKYLTKAMLQQAFDKTGKPEKGIGGLEDKSGPVDALGYAITYLAPLRRYQTGGSTVRVW